MIGWVTDDGSPCIEITIEKQKWIAVIDTGFNKDLELPQSLFESVVVKHMGSADVILAGG